MAVYLTSEMKTTVTSTADTTPVNVPMNLISTIQLVSTLADFKYRCVLEHIMDLPFVATWAICAKVYINPASLILMKITCSPFENWPRHYTG